MPKQMYLNKSSISGSRSQYAKLKLRPAVDKEGVMGINCEFLVQDFGFCWVPVRASLARDDRQKNLAINSIRNIIKIKFWT